MKQFRINLTLITRKLISGALIISFSVGVSSFLMADDETRFGVLIGNGATDKLFQWEKWTQDQVSAVGESLSADTWEDFSGRDPDSAIAITLAAWETALRENEGEFERSDLLMEFSIPLFPERSASGESLYEEIEDRWAEGSDGKFNEHFRALSKALVKKGWGGAHLRLAPNFDVESGASLWGIRDKSKHWPQFKAFWRQVHKTMMSVEGADFVWVWCSQLDGSQIDFDPIEAGWPGDEFVDVVSVVASDESRRYYWQHYEGDEPTHDWFTLRRWNWEGKAYGAVRDPYTGELLKETVPSLSSFHDFAKAKGKRFAISEWGVVRGDCFPQDEIWGGNDNPLFIEAMSQWVSDREVDYALYSETFSSSKQLGNRDHSILPGYWNQKGACVNAIHPELVGNPLSSLQYLECIHHRLPEGFKGGNYDVPILASEIFAEGVSSLWELAGPWEVKRGALHVANGGEADQAIATMKTPSINRQTMLFQMLVASEGEGVYLQVGPWRLRVSLLSDGRLGLVSLFDLDSAKAVSTGLVGKPYVIGETYVPIKLEISPQGVAIWVGDELLVNHEAEEDMEMSMDIKVIAGAGASVFLKSLEVSGGDKPKPDQ